MGWAAGFGAGTQMANSAINAYRTSAEAQLKEEAAAAGKAGMQVQTQTTSNYGKVDANAVYTGEGADGTMTNAEAASFGVNVPVEDKTAGTGVIRQYGLGTNPQKFQDAEFTPEQQRLSGLRAQADVYSGHGETDKANKILSQVQQGVLADMQIEDMGAARNRRVITDKQTDTRFDNDQTTFARTNSEADRKIGLEKEQEVRNKAFQEVAGQFAKGGWGAVPEIYKGYNDGNTATIKEDGKGGATVSLFDKDGKPAGSQVFASKADFVTGAIAKMDSKLWASQVQTQAVAAQTQANWVKDHGIRQAELGIRGATAAASIRHNDASTAEIIQKTEDKKEYSGLQKAYGDAIDSGDAKAIDAAAKKLHVYARSGKAGESKSAFAEKVDLYMRANPGWSLSKAATVAGEKAGQSPDAYFAELLKPSGGISMPIEKAEKATRAAYPDWRKADAQPSATGPRKAQSKLFPPGPIKAKQRYSMERVGFWPGGGSSQAAPPVAPSPAASGAAPAATPTPAAMAAKAGTPPARNFYGAEAINERMAAERQSDAIKEAQAKAEQDKARADWEKMRQWRLANNVGQTPGNTLLDVSFQGRP